MKKILILLVGLFALTSCGGKQKPQKVNKEKNNIFFSRGIHGTSKKMEVYEYRMPDGCQYIGDLNGEDDRARYLTHKGLCDNPKHKEDGSSR